MAAQLRLLKNISAEGADPSYVLEAFSAVRFMNSKPDRTWQTVVKIPQSRFLAAGSARDALRLIERALINVDPISRTHGNWILSIPPVGPAGFSIEICQQDGRILAQFGGLEVGFESLWEVMPWVGRALSNTFQLRTTEVGKMPRAWYLEPASDRDPQFRLAMGYAFFHKYRKTTTRIRRNSFDP